VKRLGSALAVVCVLTLAAVAAPALSTRPYRPEPVDFELAPSSRAVLGKSASSGTVVSRPLRAPKRFNLVGMRWRERIEPAIAIRARKAGGRWSRWVALDSHAEDGPDPGREAGGRGVSTPSWVGEADHVQYRMSRRVSGLRLHFVNVRGTATRADRARTAVRRLANVALASVARAVGADAAGAQAGRPNIVPRAGWGAQDCPPRAGPDYGVVKTAFIHHTVNANTYSPQEAPAVVLAICRYHRNSNGWNDIGYNFLVDRYGTIYEGRAGGIDQAVVGAQTQGYNAQSTGIANLGTFTSVGQTPAALSAMAGLIRWKLPLHGASTAGTTTLTSAGGGSNRYPAGRQVRVQRVAGHRDTNATACPGDALYAQLPELRRLVGSAGPAGDGTVISARLSKRSVRYGGRVRIKGRLRTPDGRGVAGARVEVQRRSARGWRRVTRAFTDGSGTYIAILRPRANRLLRAHFPGAGGRLTSRSRSLLVQVRPLIAVTKPMARGARRVPAPIRGRMKPAKRRLFLVLQVRRAGRYRTVGVRAVSGRRGRFRTSFTPAGTGLYRFYLVSKADRSTARSRSKPYLVRVGR
jgi:N-acetylmuramoyl-L-alanine amidase-like protein